MLALKHPPQRAQCQKAAYHEAGHAAALIVGPGPYWLRGISLRERTGACGQELPERYRHSGAHLTIDPPVRLPALLGPEQRPQAEAVLVTVLAGVTAERVLLSQRQRERAFRHELASHGLYPLLHCHSGDCPAEFRRWLEARAVHLVTCHWRGISRLAAALMEHQDLSGQEAERLLRGRS